MRDGARSIVHFKLSPNRHALNVPKLDPNEKVWENPTHHSVWTKEEVEGVQITHLPPADVSGKAYGCKRVACGYHVCVCAVCGSPRLAVSPLLCPITT